jgi:hypothetical protein
VRSRALAALLLALATLALYEPVRHHDFVQYDDPEYVLDNPNLRLPLDWRAVARAFEPYEANWIPLVWLSLHVDHRLFGEEPAGYLLENAALHAASTALLFLALASMTGAAGRSAFVAAVFAAHPLHVESVAWASERKDTLSGLFFMLGLLAYARFASRPTLARWSLVAGSLALGLLAKPMLVTFPFVLWLLDAWPLGRLRGLAGGDAAARAEARRALLEKVPMLLMVAAAAVATYAVQRSLGAMTEGDELPLPFRLGNALESTMVYLGDAFWPTGLAVFYPHRGLVLSPLRVGASGLGLLALTLLAVRARRTRPWLLVGWLWFLGTLVPVSGIVQVGLQARADRYLYLPLIGLSLAVAWEVEARWRARGLPRRALAAAAALAIAALAVGTRLQLRHWRDTHALYERAIAAVPDNYLALHNLGLVLVNEGRALEARPLLERAIALGGDSADAHAGLAVGYEELGRYPESIEQARAALAIEPGHLFAARHLIRVLATCPEPTLREPQEAIRLGESLRRSGGPPARASDADLLESLSLAYEAAGRLAEAIARVEEAVLVAEVTDDAERLRALHERLAALRAHRAARSEGAAPLPSRGE